MRRFAISLAAVLAIVPFGASMAADDAKVADATKIIDTLDVTSVGKLLAEIGLQRVETKEEGDQKLVTFSDGETTYMAGIALCDVKPGKCLALAEITVVSTGTTNVTLEMVNTYNSDNFLMTAFKLDGSKIGFGRVLIIDGGVTRLNLAVNLAAFVVSLPEALKKIQGQLTSSLERQPNPQAAAALASLRFTPVQADPRHIRAISDQLLAPYRAMLTRGIRH